MHLYYVSILVSPATVYIKIIAITHYMQFSWLFVFCIYYTWHLFFKRCATNCSRHKIWIFTHRIYLSHLLLLTRNATFHYRAESFHSTLCHFLPGLYRPWRCNRSEHYQRQEKEPVSRCLFLNCLFPTPKFFRNSSGLFKMSSRILQ